MRYLLFFSFLFPLHSPPPPKKKKNGGCGGLAPHSPALFFFLQPHLGLLFFFFFFFQWEFIFVSASSSSFASSSSSSSYSPQKRLDVVVLHTRSPICFLFFFPPLFWHGFCFRSRFLLTRFSPPKRTGVCGRLSPPLSSARFLHATAFRPSLLSLHVSIFS